MHISRITPARRGARRLTGAGIAVLTVAASLALAAPAQAQGDGTAVHTTIVSSDPAAFTPWVEDGVVESVVQVGNQIVIGGTFTQIVKANGTTIYTRSGLAAFDATTGAVSTTFAPTLDGEVTSLDVAADGVSVYAAGGFNTVNGSAHRKVVQLRVADGSVVTTFKPLALNGAVNDIRREGNTLWLAGKFTKVGQITRPVLATLDATTGALSDKTKVVFAGLHNGGVPAIREIAVTPDATKLIAVGNFTTVDGLPRDQAVLLDISGATAVVSGWQTNFFTSSCSSSFDTFMRDVAISPDGTYAVFVTTGAFHSNTSCDTISRLEITGTSAGVTPTWINMTGGDTTTAVAIVGSVVYVGGHFRWSNNSNTGDNPGQGAIDRYGLAALDPANGMPYAWNPTRERGYGVYDFFATNQGLWVGSDTSGLGYADCAVGKTPPCFQFHPRIGFFPLAGGSSIPSKAVGSVPGDVIAVGTGSTPTDSASSTAVSAALVPGGTTAMNSDSWSHARGAMIVGGLLYTAWDNRTLYVSSVSGSTIGARTAVNLNAGPNCTASNQKWCGSTSTPAPPASNALSFQLDMPNVTSMFYDSGRMYYTLTSSSYLYYRYFEPTTGYVGGVRYTAGSVSSLANVRGAFTTGGKIYFADNANSGRLYSLTFTGGVVSGTATLVDATRDWRARGLALRAQAPGNQSPTAAFTTTCSFLDCTFNGGSSSDGDGSIASYAWSFSEGGTDSGATSHHVYSTAGSYSVTLTVTDNVGATNSVTKPVDVVSVPTSLIAFRASATAATNSATAKVTVPATVQADDTLLLFVTANGAATYSTPGGWSLVGEQQDGTPDMVTRVYRKTAVAADAGVAVSVALGGTYKSATTVLAYDGVSTADPLVVTSAAEPGTSAAHAAPAVSVGGAGSWVVEFWADKTAGTTSWSVPGSLSQRAVVLGTGSGQVGGVTADSGGPVPTGSWPGATATSSTSGGKATSFSIVLPSA